MSPGSQFYKDKGLVQMNVFVTRQLRDRFNHLAWKTSLERGQRVSLRELLTEVLEEYAREHSD